MNRFPRRLLLVAAAVLLFLALLINYFSKSPEAPKDDSPRALAELATYSNNIKVAEIFKSHWTETKSWVGPDTEIVMADFDEPFLVRTGNTIHKSKLLSDGTFGGIFTSDVEEKVFVKLDDGAPSPRRLIRTVTRPRRER